MVAAIMAYAPGPHLGVMDSSTMMLQQFSGTRLWNLSVGAAVNSGIRQLNIYPSGDELLSKNLGELGVSNANEGFGGAVVTYSGDIIFVASTISNSVILGQVHGLDLSLLATFGVSNSSVAPSDGTRILLPYSMAPCRFGTALSPSDFVISAAQGGSVHGEICAVSIIPGGGMVNNPVGYVDEGLGVLGRGAIGSSLGTVFVLGKQSDYIVPSTTPLGLYVVSQGPLLSTLAKLGTVSPAQVDATWTHYSGASGCAYDQTDGNPIIQVFTTDAVVNQVYFVKLNKANAAVLWTCPVNFADGRGDADLGRHVIVNQRLYYLGAGNRLYTINTATGVATSAVISILDISGGQISEDVNNSLILYGSWNQGATVPSYVGTYMGTLGNHSLSSQWARWFVGGVPAPPPGGAGGRRQVAESGPVRI